MIGRKIKFTYIDKVYDGIILDKFAGISTANSEGVNSHNGVTRLRVPISVDFYVVDTKEDGVKKIECSQMENIKIKSL